MNILIAGFGGQGILFAGKFLAYTGLIADKQVSWLPSYGPEMRGGTANCSVVISDSPIGSPIVDAPDVLLVMNNPSMEKYEQAVVKGGVIIADETLVTVGCTRNDVTFLPLPATALAEEKGFKGLANMILMGKLIAQTKLCDDATVEQALKKCIPERKADMLAINLQALALGAGQ